MRQLEALAILLTISLLTACASGPAVTRVTLEPTRVGAGAPVYTPTPSFTPSATATASNTPTATATPTATPTLTHTPPHTSTPTASNTPTPPPSPTMPLLTPTPAMRAGAAAVEITSAGLAAAAGWSCGDFPCGDDIEGFLQRIRVPDGFAVAHIGRFPGQVMQMTYGPDSRLYATVLEDGTLDGAVYTMAADGTVARYSDTLHLPLGLTFQPGTDVLYVSARTTPLEGGSLIRVQSDGTTTPIIDDLPCCYQEIGQQPAGLVFGPDGWLYMGIGALTDHAESPRPAVQSFAEVDDLEAAVLRINPHTGAVENYAAGLREPYGLTFDANGQLYATDNGLVTGEGDRLLRIVAGEHHGWPYYRLRGCAECPPTRGFLDIVPDLWTFPDYSLPRGLVVYTGGQFPENMFNTLFVTLWNAAPGAQRVVWIDPADPRLHSDEDYEPEVFLTGLVRPVDVAIDSEGALAVADFVYGHIWRVYYTGDAGATSSQPAASTALPTEMTPQRPSGFVTSTPAN